MFRTSDSSKPILRWPTFKDLLHSLITSCHSTPLCTLELKSILAFLKRWTRSGATLCSEEGTDVRAEPGGASGNTHITASSPFILPTRALLGIVIPGSCDSVNGYCPQGCKQQQKKGEEGSHVIARPPWFLFCFKIRLIFRRRRWKLKWWRETRRWEDTRVDPGERSRYKCRTRKVSFPDRPVVGSVLPKRWSSNGILGLWVHVPLRIKGWVYQRLSSGCLYNLGLSSLRGYVWMFELGGNTR